MWKAHLDRLEVGELDLGRYEDGLLHRPERFEVLYVVRSGRHAGVIEREFERVREMLRRWE